MKAQTNKAPGRGQSSYICDFTESSLKPMQTALQFALFESNFTVLHLYCKWSFMAARIQSCKVVSFVTAWSFSSLWISTGTITVTRLIRPRYKAL